MDPVYTSSPEVKVDLFLGDGETETLPVTMFALDFGTPGTHDRYIILRRAPVSEGAYVRVESACIGHIFNLARCDCHDQLVMALQDLRDRDNYVLIYCYDHDGRANGPLLHLDAIKRMDEDGVPVSQVYAAGDQRRYASVAHIIRHVLGLSVIHLETNNPQRLAALRAAGLRIERVSFEAPPRKESHTVMSWKKNLEGHMLDLL